MALARMLQWCLSDIEEPALEYTTSRLRKVNTESGDQHVIKDYAQNDTVQRQDMTGAAVSNMEGTETNEMQQSSMHTGVE